MIRSCHGCEGVCAVHFEIAMSYSDDDFETESPTSSPQRANIMSFDAFDLGGADGGTGDRSGDVGLHEERDVNLHVSVTPPRSRDASPDPLALMHTPTSKSHVVTSAMSREALLRFETMDLDGDGFVTHAEFKSYAQSMGLSDADAENAIGVLDANGDGKIEFVEFNDWFSSRGSGSHRRASSMGLVRHASELFDECNSSFNNAIALAAAGFVASKRSAGPGWTMEPERIVCPGSQRHVPSHTSPVIGLESTNAIRFVRKAMPSTGTTSLSFRSKRSPDWISSMGTVSVCFDTLVSAWSWDRAVAPDSRRTVFPSFSWLNKVSNPCPARRRA